MVQQSRLHAPNTVGPGSIPGQGIPKISAQKLIVFLYISNNQLENIIMIIPELQWQERP